MAVHGEVHQPHWAVCSDGQSNRGRAHTILKNTLKISQEAQLCEEGHLMV